MKRCPKCGKSFPDEANFCPTDAGRLVSVATDAIAQQSAEAQNLVAGRFELGPVIGGSATGDVHRATDTQGGASVAIKLVAPQVLAIPQVAQRIDRELKQLERVQHKGVAKVLASGKHGDREFIALELIDGARPLGELVAASGAIDAQRASELVIALGEALIEAAKVGVVHRDLAPKNILVTPDAMRLINFAVPTPGDRVPGVPEFVAPESIEGKPVDQRSNIYSLGAIYYFLITGRAPHTGDPAAVLAATLAGQVDPPSKYAAVPADVDALVLRALERNAAKRYLTLRQFLDEVERVAHGPEGGVGSTAPLGRVGAPKKELSSTLMGFGLGGMPSQGAMQPIPASAPAPAPSTTPLAAAPMPNLHAAPVADAPAPASAPPTGDQPWARPVEQVVPAPVAAAVGAAASAAPPPPRVSAPVVSPQAAAPKAAGKKKAEEKPKAGSKGKFRETMWFKKGELDAQAAEEAAATGNAEAAGKADLMPIDDRYTDDGSITSTDAEKFSLKTGATSMMKAVGNETAPSQSVSERELVGEMKGGRNVIIIVIIVAILAAIGIAAAFFA